MCVIFESDHDGRWLLREQDDLGGQFDIRYGATHLEFTRQRALLFAEVEHVVVALSGVDLVDLADVALHDSARAMKVRSLLQSARCNPIARDVKIFERVFAQLPCAHQMSMNPDYRVQAAYRPLA